MVSTTLDPAGGGDPLYGLIEGGWGYRNGGKGAETYWGEIAYGGGGPVLQKQLLVVALLGHLLILMGGRRELLQFKFCY